MEKKEGRRSGKERRSEEGRRKSSDPNYEETERRSGQDRRTGEDRRKPEKQNILTKEIVKMKILLISRNNRFQMGRMDRRGMCNNYY